MSFDTILNYTSMAGVRAKLASLQATKIVRAYYPMYHGHWLPRDREGMFQANYQFLGDIQRSADDKKEMMSYVQGVCHAIWVEENARLPWSLGDHSARELQFLLEPRVEMAGWMPGNEGENGCWGERDSSLQVPRDPVADAWYQAYPLSLALVGRHADPQTAAVRLISWLLCNFFHYYEGDFGGGDPPPYRFRSGGVWLDEYFHERSLGCHGITLILAALLRSINIPAIELHYKHHGICYMPTLGRYAHGDVLSNLAVLEDPSAVLQTLPDLARWITAPRTAEKYVWEIKQHDTLACVCLRKRGRHLFVAEGAKPDDPPDRIPRLPFSSDGEWYKQLQARLPQFGIYKDGPYHYSKPVRIRELHELPECGLALEIDKDAGNAVEITLDNQGYDLPGNQGTLTVQIDGVARGTFDLTQVDQAFVKGGGRTAISTGYQIGADEDGIVRVRVENLPAPCPTLEAMRHLGRPLTPTPFDPSGPVGPVIVQPIG